MKSLRLSAPDRDQWFEKTGIALEQRERILHEIGAEAVASQTRNGRYKLAGDSIVVYSGRRETGDGLHNI